MVDHRPRTQTQYEKYLILHLHENELEWKFWREDGWEIFLWRELEFGRELGSNFGGDAILKIFGLRFRVGGERPLTSSCASIR